MQAPRFSVLMRVRAYDLNYGNHVGYQNFFSFFQEARVAYLSGLGYTELDIEGFGMIVGEANCKYRRELFLNDAIEVTCAIRELKSKLFVMEYRILKGDEVCAEGFTKNFCYDYQKKKVSPLPEAFIKAVRQFEEIE